MMHGDEFGAVWKRRLDLHVVNHLGDAVHHLRGGDDMRPRLHQVSHGAPVARPLHHKIGNQRNGFRVVEFHPALQPAARHIGRHGNQQFVFFARCQIHPGLQTKRSIFIARHAARSARAGLTAAAR